MRNVLSHASFPLRTSSRTPSTCWRSSSCTRDIHASCAGGSSGAKPYRARNPSSQSRRLEPASHVQEPPADASSARRNRCSRSRSAASARASSTASQVRSPTSRMSAISVGVHERGVALLAPKAATSCPPFSSNTPTNAAICLGSHGDPLGFREPRIGINVGHHHGLAAPELVAQRRRKAPHRPLSGKRRHAACVFAPDHILAVFELGVAHTVHAQVFPQEP